MCVSREREREREREKDLRGDDFYVQALVCIISLHVTHVNLHGSLC